MNLEFIPYFLYLIVSLIVVNITGKIGLTFINLKPQKTFFRIFLELVAGLIIIVFLYSVIKTRFMTVNILFLVIFCFYFFIIDRKRLRLPEKKSLISAFSQFHKDILILLFACLPFFLYELYFLYSTTGFNMPWADFFFYSEISDSFNFLGKENIYSSLNVVYPELKIGMIPYHYFEIWINSIISRSFHYPSILTLLLITFPLINCSVFIGITAFWESYRKINFLSISFIFLLFFTDWMYFSFYDNISYSCNVEIFSSLMSMTGKKYSVAYLFFVLFLLLFLQGKKMEAFVISGSLLIISVGLIPGILGGTFIFLFLNKFHKTFSVKDNFIIILLFLSLIFCFYLIYFQNSFFFVFSKNNRKLKFIFWRFPPSRE